MAQSLSTDPATTKPSVVLRMLSAVLTLAVLLAIAFFGLAIHFWLGWPDAVRGYGSIAFVAILAGLWLLPLANRRLRRGIVLVSLAAIALAYGAKSPVDQEWIPLHENHAAVTLNGDRATIESFRDATHTVGAPSEPRWTTAEFDLSELTGAELILQPFGPWRITEHAMITFSFADGRHLTASIEARRAAGGGYNPLAGFFRHDQTYPVIGTERDLIWKRLARDPPFEMQFYSIEAPPEAVRIYLRRLLEFANSAGQTPRFYNTMRESCLTALIRLAPESFANVPWFDIRQWIPGYIISLMQDLGLVDDSVPADTLAERQRLRSGIKSPLEFPGDVEWSAYLRSPS